MKDSSGLENFRVLVNMGLTSEVRLGNSEGGSIIIVATQHIVNLGNEPCKENSTALC